MRTSIGLIPENLLCRYHHTPLKPRIEPAPLEQYTGQLHSRPTRVVYRCRKKGCPFCAVGTHSKIHLTTNSSGTGGLSWM